MSRLIIKNIPNTIEENKLREIFAKVGTVTDCKIAEKDGKSRRFCFIGFKTNEEAKKAQGYFNNTYIGTSKVIVDFAKTKDDPELKDHKNKKNSHEKMKRQRSETHKQQLQKEGNQKLKKRYEEYKQLISKGSKQSWNDLLIPEEVISQPKQFENNKKNKNKGKSADAMEQKQQPKQIQKKVNKKILPAFKPSLIKAPILTPENQKYVKQPLKVDETRLFVTNFPYDIQQEELKGVFSKYGEIIKIKLPKNNQGRQKGYGFITYSKAQQALRAFSQLDNKIVFGKILHIKPALQDIGSIITNNKEQQYQQKIKEKFGDPTEDKTSYKKKKKIEMRKKLDDTTNWNTLFLNPNTILEHVSKKLGVTKSEILLSQDLPAKVALAETEVINQTKQWMISQGLNLDFLETDRNLCERSKEIILVKNLHHNTQPTDLKQLFNYYGLVQKLLLCPNRTIAIVEFQNEKFARNAFQKLSYYSFKSNPLYLQYAPINLMTRQKVTQIAENIKKQQEEIEELNKVLYVKNLNFQTTQDTLKNHFKNIGPIKSVRIVRSKEGVSSGYGFIEYENKEGVIKAIKVNQNSLLEGHTLQLSISKKKIQINVNKRKKAQVQFQPTNPKIIVRNLAFQATKNDLRNLFKEFGIIKAIRIPKKMDGQHRGFGFVEFQTIQEAMQAHSALSNSHLYGRKLVLEWEESSKK